MTEEIQLYIFLWGTGTNGDIIFNLSGCLDEINSKARGLTLLKILSVESFLLIFRIY